MKPIREYTETELLKKMESLCAYQERSAEEVRQKLWALGATKKTTQTIVAQLIADNYINDARFAVAFARGKHKFNQWGKNRIALELEYKHKIPSALITPAINALDDAGLYTTTLKYLSAKKMLQWQDETSKFEKTCQYLLQKGYDLNDVIPILNQIEL